MCLFIVVRFNKAPLGGNRSISEDSVFNPEQREATGIHNKVASTENVHATSFQVSDTVYNIKYISVMHCFQCVQECRY